MNKPPQIPPQLLQLTKIFQLELEIMLNKLDTTDKEDPLKVSHKVILLTEEAELVDKTDQENKVEEEETLATSKTNLIKKNIKNLNNKLQVQQLNNL